MPRDRKVPYYRDPNDQNAYKGDNMPPYYDPSDEEEEYDEEEYGRGKREGVRPEPSQAKRWPSGGMAYNNGLWANADTAAARYASGTTATPTLTRNAVGRGRERETRNHNAASHTQGFGEPSFGTDTYRHVQNGGQSWERGSAPAFAENTSALNYGSGYDYAPEPSNFTREASPDPSQDALNSLYRRLIQSSQNAGQSFSSAAPPAATYGGHGHDQGSVYRQSRGTSGNSLAAGERQYIQGPLFDNGFQPAGHAFTRRPGNAGGYPTGQLPGFSLPRTPSAPRGSGHVPAANRRTQESSQLRAMPQALSGPSQYYTHLPPLSIQVPAVSGVPLPAGTPNAYRIAQEQSLDPVLREYLRLEKSHKSHEKARAEAYRIADIVGHVVMFCVENSGSRLVQALIEGGNCDVREQVLQEVHSNLLQLSKDAYGNYVIQKLLQYCTQPQKIIIWNALKGNVASLSCNKHACRVVQDALEHVLVTQQVEIIEEMKPALEDLMRDQYGNHLVQVALEVVARPHVDFIYQRFRGRVCQLAQDVHCCRILQTMLIKGEVDDRASIMRELSARFEDLCTHQFGNYVLQKAIKYALPADRDMLVAVLMRDPFRLAQDKAGSHVLETIINEGTLEERKAILANFMVVEPTGVRRLETLLLHEFGNYVCKTLLKKLRIYDRQAFDSLWQDVYPFLLQTRHNSTNKTVKTIDEILKDVLKDDFDMAMLTNAASRLRVDVVSPAPTPQLTMEPNSPTSNPPSTRDSVDEPVNTTLLPGTDKALRAGKGTFADVKIRRDSEPPEPSTKD